MTIKELISAIERKHKDSGITLNPPASIAQLQEFERKLGFELPADFKEFYSLCNAFECTKDIFKVVALEDAMQYQQDYGKNRFHFTEYMNCSDMWSLRKRTEETYEIVNMEEEIVLTTSLQEFLQRFLQGNVFEEGGLYDWHKVVKQA